MSGQFYPRVSFPIYIERAKSGRVDIEPFFSIYGYGITAKVIFQLVGGCGKGKYLYERVICEDAMVRKLVSSSGDEENWELFSEYIEGFYHNKVGQDMVVPVAALILKTYFPEIVDDFSVDLSEYITEISFDEGEQIGFKPR